MDQVRRSIVRISFDWKKGKKGYQFMVIAGVIVSINNNGSCIIIADSTFFLKNCDYVVNFPNDGGYELEPSEVSEKVRGDDFYTLVAKPKVDGYVQSVTFETGAIKTCDVVHGFVFPREGYITPTGYCAGSIIDGTQADEPEVRVSFHDCAFHEYAYLGSPVFNGKGHLVGISYSDQGRVHAWTVSYLRNKVFNKIQSLMGAVSYVSDGAQMPDEAPMPEE